MPPSARNSIHMSRLVLRMRAVSRVLVICASVPSLCLLKQIARIVTGLGTLHKLYGNSRAHTFYVSILKIMFSFPCLFHGWNESNETIECI
jgi:hypothetical protein